MAIVADVHNHVIPAGFLERVRSDGGRLGYSLVARDDDRSELTTPDGSTTVRREQWDQELRLRALSVAGITLALSGISPSLVFYRADEPAATWVTTSLNDALAEDVRAHPDRISGLAAVPLQFPMIAVRELERSVAVHGMRGVQIFTNVNGENLDEPEFHPFWDAAQSLGVLIFVHPNFVVGKHRLSRYHLRNLIGNPLETSIAIASIVFGGVLDRYPALKFCFAHAGGYVPWVRGRWRHGQSVRKETRARGASKPLDDYLGQIYVDTIVHSEAALRYLIEMFGSDHILHGTDYPADMADTDQVQLIRSLPSLSVEDKDKILGGNVLRLIGRTDGG